MVHSRRIFAAVLLSYNAVGEARGEATVHTSCDLSLPAVLMVSKGAVRAVSQGVACETTFRVLVFLDHGIALKGVILHLLQTMMDSQPSSAPSTSSTAINVTLEEKDIEGASLEEPLDSKTVPQLRWWLLCHGVHVPTNELSLGTIELVPVSDCVSDIHSDGGRSNAVN